MDFTKTCATCGVAKPFSYYKPTDSNIRTINKGNKPMNRKFREEDLEEVCVTCQEKRSFKFDRASDHIQEDYVFELGARPTELSEEEQEWWTLPEEEAHSFSYPPRKEWFQCKGCSALFPKSAKYRNTYKYCDPCGLDYNRRKRMLSYNRKKEMDNSATKKAIDDTRSDD
jgi:hypothetical protein